MVGWLYGRNRIYWNSRSNVGDFSVYLKYIHSMKSSIWGAVIFLYVHVYDLCNLAAS